MADAAEQNLLLQAHLWLGNRDLAVSALNSLAERAAGGDGWDFFRIREQCWECSGIGLGPELAGLMDASAWADFLRPFSLALKAAASGESPSGAAPEILSLAGEVLQEIRCRNS